MVIYQIKSKRKPTGGRYKRLKVKKLSRLGNHPRNANLNEKRIKTVRSKGGNLKKTILSINTINVFDKNSNKHKLVKIENVMETPANRNFVTRNIMTKGAVVKTELGNVKITSRPGQEGSLEGILV